MTRPCCALAGHPEASDVAELLAAGESAKEVVEAFRLGAAFGGPGPARKLVEEHKKHLGLPRKKVVANNGPPTRARADSADLVPVAEIPDDPKTHLGRVQIIARYKERSLWNKVVFSRDLAEAWGLAENTIHKAATDAEDLVEALGIAEKRKARLFGAGDRALDIAEADGDAMGMAKVLETLGRLYGLIQPPTNVINILNNVTVEQLMGHEQARAKLYEAAALVLEELLDALEAEHPGVRETYQRLRSQQTAPVLDQGSA